MTPTFQFRWYSTVHQVTAAMVAKERDATDESMLACKKRLEGATKPVLQQWFAAQSGDSADQIAAGGQWRNVEVVVEVLRASDSHTEEGAEHQRPSSRSC